MNTENRSSNTEMVSVPREWAQHYADLLEDRCGYEKAEQVTAFLAQPAQHHGEPVALPARKHPVRADYSQDILAEGWNACLNEIAKMGPLYPRADPGEVVRFGIQVEKLLCGALGREWSATGISIETLVAELKAKADPGEVERLRTELDEWKERCQRNSDEAMSWMAKHDAMRAQLAERATVIPKGFALVPQSMLLSKEVIGAINFHCGDTDQEEGGQFGQYADGRLWIGYVQDDDGNQVHGLQLATDEYPEEGSTTLIEFPAPQEAAEPGAATESESRAAFEAAYSQEVAVTEMAFLTNPDGSYALPIVNTAYRMWQAGAATKGAKA